MKILVTGANGQLGSELRRLMPELLPHTPIIYTDIQELDLTDAPAVTRFMENNEISHVINCAAYTRVDAAEEEKALCTAINSEAVKNLAIAADSIGAKIIHISTDYVFDGLSYRPYRETDKVNPKSHYGTTKRAGETALLALSPHSIIIRTGWLYSPYGHNFLKTILNKAEQNKILKVVNDQIGTPTYAADLATAICKILQSTQWVEGIYHYANEGVCSWYDFACAIIHIVKNHNCHIEPIPTEDYPTTAIRPPFSVLDKTKIRLTYSVNTPHWFESLTNCIARL